MSDPPSIAIRRLGPNCFELICAAGQTPLLINITHKELVELVSALGMISSYGTLQKEFDCYKVFFLEAFKAASGQTEPPAADSSAAIKQAAAASIFAKPVDLFLGLTGKPELN